MTAPLHIPGTMVLVGPTASGKTALALETAGDRFEILSVDSVQVYRHMDIGSGKPTPEERRALPHHCIDLVDPDYPFTAADFVEEARKGVESMKERGKVPFFVGGTGLYLDAWFLGLDDIPEVSLEVRNRVLEDIHERGHTAMFDELRKVDPYFASSIHPNDSQRLGRGLEVYRETGRPLSSYFARKSEYPDRDIFYAGIHMERKELHGRIEKRVDDMMRRGFLEEVRRLRDMGYGPDLKSMRSIGYREMQLYLEGTIDLEEAVRIMKRETRRYARRQMTWFRARNAIRWYDEDEWDRLRKDIAEWGKEINTS